MTVAGIFVPDYYAMAYAYGCLYASHDSPAFGRTTSVRPWKVTWKQSNRRKQESNICNASYTCVCFKGEICCRS